MLSHHPIGEFKDFIAEKLPEQNASAAAYWPQNNC
jgi:hypothetical protein